MDLRNCRKCDRMYSYDQVDLCPKCRSNNAEELKLVKEYLYDNPKSTISQVSANTKVDTNKILKLLREEKIEIAEGSENMILDCERCGSAIRCGKFCPACINELRSELKSVSDAMKEENAPKEVKKQKNIDKLFIASRLKR